MLTTERIAINLGNWKNKEPEAITSDLASFAGEASTESIERRINAGVVGLKKFECLLQQNSQDPEDIATRQIYQWAQQDSPSLRITTCSTSPSDREILESMQDCLDINPQTMVLWLSPPLENHYKESRIIIYQTIEVNGKKFLFFRAICGKQTAKECLAIAEHLLQSSSQAEKTPDTITNPEKLRATPFLFLISGEESWINYLSRFIDMPAVWKTIANGEDLRNKGKALVIAQNIVDQNYQKIIYARSFEEWTVGVKIEQALQKGLGITLQSGPCGTLYSDLNRPWATIIPLGINNLFSSEKKAKFIKNCGACGKELNQYMTKGDRCPYCNGVYEGC